MLSRQTRSPLPKEGVVSDKDDSDVGGILYDTSRVCWERHFETCTNHHLFSKVPLRLSQHRFASSGSHGTQSVLLYASAIASSSAFCESRSPSCRSSSHSSIQKSSQRVRRSSQGSFRSWGRLPLGPHLTHLASCTSLGAVPLLGGCGGVWRWSAK